MTRARARRDARGLARWRLGPVALAALAAAPACGPRTPRGSWLEEELGQSRVGPGGGAPARARGTPAEARARLDAALGAGDPVAIVTAAVDVAALGGDVAPARDAIHDAIDALRVDELEAALAAADPARAPSGALALRLALLARHAGDAVAARAWLDVHLAAADAADAALAARAAELAAQVTPPDPAVVAVALPLSGRFAPLGEELRAAIELAPRDGATLVFLDTTGTEVGAIDAVDRAAARGAVAILGPVGEREGGAAARRAVELGIPIALLAPLDGADPDAGVFRMVASAADEARLAARVAAQDSVPTAAVLAPRDDVGQAMADAFVAEATAFGIAVTRVGTYDPTATDLEPDLKDFLDLDPARNERLARHLRRHGKKGWQTFSPDVDFSLLYLPDSHDRAALVAAFLPYLGVELRTVEFPDLDLLARKHGGRIPQVVQLLGSAGWRHPGLLTRGGEVVEGAVIVDVCAGALDDVGASGEVAARLRERLGRESGRAALEAHDAARLVIAARAAAADGDAAGARERVRAALARGALDDGGCGAGAVGADGAVARDPVIIAVEDGELVLASW